MPKGFIVYPTYKIENNKAYVYLFGRLENGESFHTINYFRPYFYIRSDDLEKAKKLAKFDTEKTGFKNFSGEDATKIILDIPKSVPEIKKLFTDNSIICYEADIRFAYRFLIDNDLKGCVNIEGKYEKGEFVDRVYTEPEITPAEYLPELSIASIDIETNIKATKIFSIAIYSKEFKKVLIVKDGKDAFKNAETFNSEKEMLFRFKEIILEKDFDIITGWNVIDFDFKIIKEKFSENKIDFILGRVPWECKLRLSDSFFKDSDADIPGRTILDGLHLAKVSFIKLEDYKLNTAAKTILGEEKLITGEGRWQDIEKYYKEDPQHLINYNLKDAQLAYDIVTKSKMIELTIKRTMLTRMQLDRVDASIASFDSLYLKELQKIKVVAPTANVIDSDERIKGGYVREPLPGIYDNIIVLDFKSLYPSIMRTFNIDPLDYVHEKDAKKYKKEELVKAPNGAYFKNHDGILPKLIQELWKQRDIAKKEKDQLRSNAIKILMNSLFGVLANPACRFYSIDIGNAITHFGQQLIKMTAEKISERGYEVIYGDSVTKDTEIILQNSSGEIEFKKIGELFTKAQTTSAGKEYCFNSIYKVLTLDKDGNSCFKDIKYVMRHKTDKKIYRIYFTNEQYIETTEDHSLIGYINKQKNQNLSDLERLKEVSPLEIGEKINTIVSLKVIPRKKTESRKYPKEVYEFMGLFIGDGSFNSGNNKKNYYLHLAGGKDTAEIVKKVIIPLQKKGFVKNYWLKKKGDICINGLKLVELINTDFRKLGKVIPEFLTQETDDNICSFLRGLFSSDGTVIVRNNRPIIRFTNTNQEIIKMASKLLFLAGIVHSIFRENRNNSYLGKLSNTVSKHIYVKNQILFKDKIDFLLQRKSDLLKKISDHSTHKRTIKKYDFDLSKVIKIENIKYADYVYDIEVENTHRFFANNVLVHNTDSIFINPKIEDSEVAIKKGREIADYVTKFFKDYIQKEHNRESFMELQFEKVFKKFFLPTMRGGKEGGAKKRYAGIREKDGKDVLDFTGMESKRRDWTDVSKKFQNELLMKVFRGEKVENYVRDFVNDVKSGKYDSLLVYKKAIRKSVESYTKTPPPHIQAARKAGKTDVGIIEYYMTVKGPEISESRKSKIDYGHYIEKQIKPIADSVLVFFDTNFDDLIKGSKQRNLFDY